MKRNEREWAHLHAPLGAPKTHAYRKNTIIPQRTNAEHETVNITNPLQP